MVCSALGLYGLVSSDGLMLSAGLELSFSGVFWANRLIRLALIRPCVDKFSPFSAVLHFVIFLLCVSLSGDITSTKMLGFALISLNLKFSGLFVR